MMGAVAPGRCERQNHAATICRIVICAWIAYRVSQASLRMRYRFSTEKHMKLKVLLLAAIGTLAMQSVWAANISVTEAWARATMPGQKVSGAYMQIRSDADARLVSASSPAVPRVEMHEMRMDGDVMRMREVKAIDLPKGKTVSLEPGGFHIMLMNLPQPIAAGDVIPLILTVESGGKRQTVEVKAEARGVGNAMPLHHHH
jgi:copper(I)-binding protein